MCVCVLGGATHVPAHMCGGRGQLVRVGFCLPSCGTPAQGSAQQTR